MKGPGLDKLKSSLADLKSNTKAIVAIAAAILILDGAFVLRGQFVSVIRMFNVNRKLKADIKRAEEDANFFSTYKDRVGDLKRELERLNKMSVTEEDLPSIMESISKFGDISGVRILKIKPIIAVRRGPGVSSGEEEGFKRQRFALTVRCGFHQLGRFVALLENSPVFLDIRDVNIRGDEQQRMKHLVTIMLEVVITKT